MPPEYTLPEDFNIFDSDFNIVDDILDGLDPIDWSDFINPSPGGPDGGSGSSTTLWGGIDNYKKALMQGANYFDINDVDNVDDWYNNQFAITLRGMGATPETYFKAVSGTPEYLKTFNSPATDLTITDAFNRISRAGSPEEITTALSEYYGYDVPLMDQTFTDFGGNLASHSGSSTERLKEFHSIVEPILLEQIPYLQAVEGLSYEDALVEAYARDPMLQALYFKYDVSPIRQTEDGSTYLYDPFSFSEIRTYESKDPNLARMATNVIAGFALSAFLGPVVGKFVEGTLGVAGTTGTALTNALTSASVAGLQGGDLKTALTSGMFAGLGTYAAPVVTSGLDASGLTAEVLDKYGIVQDDFANALASATMEVGAGGNVGDALLSAATSYLRNAGIPGVETPKFVEDIRNAGRFIDDMVQSVLPEGFLDSLDFGNLSESQVAEFAKQAEEVFSLVGDAYDEDIEPDDRTIGIYDKIISDIGVDALNDMGTGEIYSYLIKNKRFDDLDYLLEMGRSEKLNSLVQSLNNQGGSLLNLTPSLLREGSTTFRFDTDGNLLSNTQSDDRGVAYEVRTFGQNSPDPDTFTIIDVQEDIQGTGGGGGGGGDSSSADGGSGQPPATDTTTPTDAIDGGGGATGGGTTTTGGGGTTSPTPGTTAPSTGGGGGGGAVVVSGGSDGDTTEVNTPAASSQANYTQQELDDAIAKALAEAQKNDPTEFDQADLDAAVAEAVKEVIENDPTDFTQEDINTAVDNALNKQSKEYEQQITELKGAAEKARIKAANDARKAAEAKAAVAAAKAAKQSKAKIAAAEAKQKQAEERAINSANDARKSKAQAQQAEEARRQAERAKKTAQQKQKEAEQDKAKADAARAKAEDAKAKAERLQSQAESQRDTAKRAQAQAEANQAKAEAAKSEAEATAAEAVQANKEAQDKKADADEAKSNAAKAREAAEKEIDAARKAQKEAEADAEEAKAAQKAAEAQAAADAAEAANQAARDAEAAYEQGYGEGAASTGAGSDAGDADSGDTGTGVTDGEGTKGGVGSGDGTGEGTGSGTGTGSGSGAGDGSGTGAGSGTGDGSGMFAGLGGVTGEIFDDYVKFKKSAVMPTRQARPKLKGYTAPPVGLFRNII